MKYLLDTNVCVDYLSGRYPRVIERIQALRPGDLGISTIVEAELHYGVARSTRRAHNRARLHALLESIERLPFDSPAANEYGRIRQALEARGAPIGPNDLLIAAQARAHDLVLVTDNVAEFRRVTGLRVENWRVPS